MDLSNDIAFCIYNMNRRGRLLLFRNGEELDFLRLWLNKGFEKDGADADSGITLEEMIHNCHKCGSIYNKKAGFGTGENRILIVLNRPKGSNDTEGTGLRNESIVLLKKMIKAMNVDYNECYITNIIKCESRDAVNRPSLMFKNCEKIFVQELREKCPEIVIVMGNSLPLKKIMGEYKDVAWYTVEHPVTLIKNPGLKRDAWEVLKRVMVRIRELNTAR